jgi:hypothetical protein
MFNFTKAYADKALLKREKRSTWLRALARVAEPRNALVVIVVTATDLRVAVWQSRDRVIGTLQPGAPELREDARFNRDAVAIAEQLRHRPRLADGDLRGPARLLRERRARRLPGPFTWAMQNVPKACCRRFLRGATAHLQRGLQRGQSEDERGAHRSGQLRRAQRRDRPVSAATCARTAA